jgi:hypothetical protein
MTPLPSLCFPADEQLEERQRVHFNLPESLYSDEEPAGEGTSGFSFFSRLSTLQDLVSGVMSRLD